MREFVYFSNSAVTSPNLIKEDLMKCGRLDIACQVVIHSFFVSHAIRPDVKVHLVFNGPPDPPKHLEMFPSKNLEDVKNKIDISKKDIAGLIKKMLYKYKKGERVKVAEGYFVEKKSFVKLLEELSSEGKEIYVLDKRGEDIRNMSFGENVVFILGDHEGIPKREMKWSKHLDLKRVSVGPYTLFASQVVTLVHNELDRKEVSIKE